MVVSKQPATETMSALEELARDQHATPVRDIAELRADVWVAIVIAADHIGPAAT
jgi:hypothetical protein